MDDVRYAVSGDAAIAYRVSGSGPGVVYLGNWGTNMEAVEGAPDIRLWLEGLAANCRFVIYDQRGTGLSDRGSVTQDLDVWLHDLETVLDAAELPSAVLVGSDLNGPVAIAYAARRPDRVSGLVLIGSYARTFNGDGYTAGIDPSLRDAYINGIVDGWGVPESDLNRMLVPGREHASWREQCGRVQRLSVSPHGLRALLEKLFDVDVVAELESVRAPTLVLHNTGDRAAPVSGGRFLAEHIPGAQLVEYDSDQHFVFFEFGESSVDEILAFSGLGMTHRVGGSELAVVWFSDIVASTERLLATGDDAWGRRLEEHDRLADRLLVAYGGELVKRLGDGILALFRSTQDAARCAVRFSAACPRMELPVRVGLHVGDIERRPDGDITGVAVHTAQRVQSAADAGEVLATETVRGALAGTQIDLRARGTHDLKGMGPTELYAIRDA